MKRGLFLFDPKLTLPEQLDMNDWNDVTIKGISPVSSNCEDFLNDILSMDKGSCQTVENMNLGYNALTVGTYSRL